MLADNVINSINLKFYPIHRLYGMTFLIITVFLVPYSISMFDYSSIIVICFLLSHSLLSAVKALSVLRLTDNGIYIRRGWQRAFIPWSSVELIGFAKHTILFLIPYIVLREPIAGFNQVKLADIAPEHQQRTITIEGWDKQQQIIETIYQKLPQKDNAWYVMPTIKRNFKSFIYYDHLNLYITGFSAIVAITTYLIKYFF